MSDKQLVLTQEQIDILSNTFPENTMCNSDTTPYELYRRLGVRQVIQHLQANLDNHKRKIANGRSL